MGIFSAVDRRSTSSLSNPDQWFINMVNGNPTSSGVRVDEDEALSLSTVFAAVRIISETLGSVPVKLYERVAERTKRDARNNVIYQLLHDEPNEEQTPLEFYEMVQGFAELAGTGYAEIIRDGTGRGREMWPIPTQRVTPIRLRSGSLVYRVTYPNGPDRTIPYEDMLTVRGFSRDGVSGLKVVDTMREPLGIAKALDMFAGSYFGNGAEPGGIIKSPKKLTDDAKKRLKDGWQARHGGASKRNRVALLEEGIEWIATTVDPEKSQAMEARKFSVNEVARIFNLPPHILKDLERATFSNVEQQALDFVTVSMRPRFVRFAQALEKKLILPSQRSRLYIEHVIEALLVGDIKTRFDSYAVGKQNGWLSANDIREKENQNPIEGGDEYLVQVNMIPTLLLPGLYGGPQAGQGSGSNSARAALTEAVRRRLEGSYARLFEDAAARAVRAEVDAVRKLLKRSAGSDSPALPAALGTFYEKHCGFMRRAFLPALTTWAEIIAFQLEERVSEPASLQAFMIGYADELAQRESEYSLDAIGAQLTAGADVEVTLQSWEASRARDVAQREVRAVSLAVEKFVHDNPRKTA
jgi:HK97 family phage portal protein